MTSVRDAKGTTPNEIGTHAPAGTIVGIQARHFRSLHGVDADLSRFLILVGPNASGKSNLLDVVAFLGDFVHSGLEATVGGDPALGIPLRASDARHLVWMQRESHFELAVEATLPAERVAAAGVGAGGRRICRYEIRVQVEPSLRVVRENLWLKPPEKVRPRQPDLFPEDRTTVPEEITIPGGHRAPKDWKAVVRRSSDDPERIMFYAERTKWQNPFRIRATRSALANLPDDEERFPAATWFKSLLRERIHRLALSGEALRMPSPPTRRGPYLPDGSNLPWVVHELEKKDPQRLARWLDHVREALPDIRGVYTREREEDRHRYLVVRYGSELEAPSWTVSDGTLRFLALTLLAYAPAAGIHLIEEPENGLHPRALESIYQSLSSVYRSQVLLATHSPVLLAAASPSELLCFAKTAEGATQVVRGDRHPRLREWRGTLDLGTLFASGLLG